MKYNEIKPLARKGVYQIVNLVNNKTYVGSTTQSFIKRYNDHIYHLEKGSHKNNYLQNSWNKYGADNFDFRVLEVCKSHECIAREQHYLDMLKPIYNINKTASNVTNPKIIKKRNESIRNHYSTMSLRYKDYKKGDLKLDQLTDQEQKQFKIWSNHVPWNKGIKMKNTDHLKVPKRKKGTRNNAIFSYRTNTNCVIVKKDNKILGTWRSIIDLAEWSMSNLKKLPITPLKRRYNDDRDYYLQNGNISYAARTGAEYKGLLFEQADPTALPYGDICVVSDELLGSPSSDTDNQQPSSSKDIIVDEKVQRLTSEESNQ